MGGLSKTLLHSIIKCHLVECVIDFNEGKCFQELPVRIRQEDGTLSANLSFVDPVTHVIEPVGTEAPCSSTMPQYYKLDGEW